MNSTSRTGFGGHGAAGLLLLLSIAGGAQSAEAAKSQEPAAASSLTTRLQLVRDRLQESEAELQTHPLSQRRGIEVAADWQDTWIDFTDGDTWEDTWEDFTNV